MSLTKFYELNGLKSILALERKKNKTAALANGGFDLVHIGHIRYLQGAKKNGGYPGGGIKLGQIPEKIKRG